MSRTSLRRTVALERDQQVWDLRAQNGQTVIALGNQEATIKKCYRRGNRIDSYSKFNDETDYRNRQG